MSATVFEEGRRDAHRGLARFANPYAYGASKGSKRYAMALEWGRGWDTGNMEDDDE